MQNSEVIAHDAGMTFVGPDAVNAVRAAHLKVALSLYAETGMLTTRGATPTVLLKMATEYTGHKYKRGAYLEAAQDVADWLATMKAALPFTDERTKA
jgi:hypothetical protein